MIFALVGAVVILTSPWIFFYFSPSQRKRPGLRRFNRAVVLIATFACAMLALWVRQRMVGAEDFAWWPAVAVAYSALLFPMILLIGGVIRNFVVFPDVK